METFRTATTDCKSSPWNSTCYCLGCSSFVFFLPRLVPLSITPYRFWNQALTIRPTDWSTSRVMASIKNMLPDDCSVIRGGIQQTLSSTEIVPGDLLIIRSGDKLPADVRFIQVSSDVKFDRAVLTGNLE
jgi:magnesium-transporting ATPase (P-type)